MAQARAFSVLYNLVAQIAQDTSTTGITNAKTGINEVIKELTRDFDIPSMLKGQYGDVFVSVPAQTQGLGYQKVALGVSDVRSISIVWYEQNGQIYQLDQAQSDEDWLSQTDNYNTGDPKLYRYFAPDNSGTAYIQFFPGASAAWVANSAGKIKFSYWSELIQLSADGDIPNIAYELDPILVNGGLYKVGLMQGDNVLKDTYEAEYEKDRGNLRAWITKQKSKDQTIKPKIPQGVFGRVGGGQGYKSE